MQGADSGVNYLENRRKPFVVDNVIDCEGQISQETLCAAESGWEHTYSNYVATTYRLSIIISGEIALQATFELQSTSCYANVLWNRPIRPTTGVSTRWSHCSRPGDDEIQAFCVSHLHSVMDSIQRYREGGKVSLNGRFCTSWLSVIGTEWKMV